VSRGELSPRGIELGSVGTRWARIAVVVGLVGLVITVARAATLEHGAEAFFHSYLVNLMFYLSLALGGLFFVLISHLVRASWSVVLRRIAEVLAWSILPLTPPAAVLLFGLHDLYEWSHAETVANDPLLQHKAAWLNPTFFVIRFGFYFIVWNLLSWFFLRQSVRQDSSQDYRLTIQMERLSAPGTIFFAMTVTFASFDYIMSLYPHWYSTIFGVYYFSGSVLAIFSLVSILGIGLERAGKLREVLVVGHYHDLGRLMFAFVVFWAYIAVSQFLLIWYANIPEETEWYLARKHGGWWTMSMVLLFGHFVVPFLWLMSRHVKRRKPVLFAAGVFLLLMHWLDLYYLIMPDSSPAGPSFGLLDLGCFLMLGGLLFSAVFWRMGRSSLVPIGDPRLDESLGLENV
jgi:hypothetical protein